MFGNFTEEARKILTVAICMAMAAVTAGADGLIIEVHPHPEVALCDGDQSLTPADFKRTMKDLKKVAALRAEF